jgi:hypothetical protein
VNSFALHLMRHGAPATGKVLSDLILKGTTDIIDARVLRPERFAEGDTVHETALL